MRIGIFPVMAGRRAGGVETYEVGLVRSLAVADRDNEYHVFCVDHRAAESFEVVQENFQFHILRPANRLLSIPASLPIWILRSGCELLHATYIPPLWSPVPYVFTMYDTSVFDRPEFYHVRHRHLLQFLQRKGVKGAARVICISATTRDRVIDWFRLPPQDLALIYIGAGPEFRPLEKEDARARVRERFGIVAPYALYVGQLRTKHKNILGLLEAFALFRRQVSERVVLLLVGKRSWTTEGIEESIARLGLEREVILPGHVPQEDLPWLYSGAAMFVFPSFSEGFGLSVIEAMACGAPVITSNYTSLPEVTGESALLVDPHSPEAIAQAMRRVHTDTTLAAELARRGIERARLFSFEECARQTMAVYRQLTMRSAKRD